MSQRKANDYWIDPLLKRFDLVGKREEDLARDAHWKQIESCELTERIGKIVVDVNRAAGYRVLEMVEFLPPQKNILRVSFERHRVKHSLEVAIRESGIVLMFSTSKRASTGWARFLSINSARNHSTLVWEQDLQPAEILEQNIQAWLSYLLSGLDKKFRLDQMLHSSETPDAALEAALRKISA